jgi:hypothetical protein
MDYHWDHGNCSDRIRHNQLVGDADGFWVLCALTSFSFDYSRRSSSFTQPPSGGSGSDLALNAILPPQSPTLRFGGNTSKSVSTNLSALNYVVSDRKKGVENMAEREGFEPPIPVKACPLSRRIVSTTHAPLRRKLPAVSNWVKLTTSDEF